VTGQLEYLDHARNISVRSTWITGLSVSDGEATFAGNCTKNGEPCTFTVMLSHAVETGAEDRFAIEISGEPTVGGPIASGSINIRSK